MSEPRFAIYFIPEASSPLYRLGASVLVYDCYTRAEPELPRGFPITDIGWMRLTEEPRRYGFHATLKAPFHLADTTSQEELEREMAALATATKPVSEIELKVDLVNDFIALVPRVKSGVLDLLAAQCVERFDRFRAPITEKDRARRMKAPLSPRQIQNLDHWGYPYVFEDFRFHMTLTGALNASDQTTALKFLFKCFGALPLTEAIQIDRLALVRQDWPKTRFYVVSLANLAGN